MVKTFQFTTKCKIDSKNQNNRSIIITKHMRWVLHLNLLIDRFKY